VKRKTLTSAARVLSLLLLASSFYAKADTLIQITSGTGQSAAFGDWGQSFTIPGNGQFDNITFNFFDSQGHPLAGGNGYLFSSPYIGLASALSPDILTFQLPSFLGFANSSGGVYSFLPFVSGQHAPLILNAGTTYYFYEDDEFLTLSGGAAYTGGLLFIGQGGPFEEFAIGAASNFKVTGTPVVGVPPGVTPEPSSLIMLGTGILGLAGAARRTAAYSNSPR
jgi:hypothetical protein